MSCTEFETMVTDLAGDRLMEAMSRRRLQLHADECPSCAARLDTERVLSARLDALAEETEHESADPALKGDLLAAFSKLHTPQRNFVVHAPQRSPRYWQLAAAAAIIVTFVSVALLMRNSSTPTEVARVEATPSVIASPVVAPSLTPALNPEQTTARVSNASVSRARPATRAITVKSPSNEIASLAEETTTEYLPLTYTSDQTALQTGVVVRVEIPRATLVSMGLPMNTDRGNTLVKADVVVGDDGVPRAIRLVH
jgi:hypothetical protein